MKISKNNLSIGRIKKIALLGSFMIAGIACAEPGDLDPRFGFAPDFIGFGQGYVTLDGVGAREHQLGANFDMTVDGAGRALIAEAWHTDAMTINTEVFLRRLDANGQLDEMFGTASIASPGRTVGSMKIARRDRSDIPQVAVATYRPEVSWQYIGDPTMIFQAVGIGNEIHVIAYHANGQLNTNFGPDHNGQTVFTLAGQVGYDLDMVADRGVITLVTSSDDRGESRRNCFNLCSMAILRMDVSGQPINDYGTGGIAYFVLDAGMGAKNRLQRIAINRTNGQLYVAGRLQRVGRDDIDLVLGRLDANGYPDVNFGPLGGLAPSSGFRVFGTPNANEWARGLVIQPNGRIVVGGYEQSAGADTFLNRGMVWGFRANGSPDTSFGNAGKTRILAPPYFYGFDDSTLVSDIALDAEGRILAGGNSLRPIASKIPGEPLFEARGLMARLDANGHMDFGFGTAWGAGGVSETSETNGCYEIGILSDRPICLGLEPNSSTGPWRVLGYQP